MLKNLIIYMPLTGFPTISSRTFKTFTSLVTQEQADLYKEKYGVNTRIFIHDRFPIDMNRNEAFELALGNKYQADYILCLDADQVFKPTVVTRLMDTLLESPDVGGVTGIYFRKSPPHRCVVGKYSPWSESLEKKRQSLKEQGFIDPKTGEQTLYFKPLLYFDAVQPVDAFGLGCILFRADIFKQLKQPYCKYVNPYSTGGDYSFDGCSEDMWLCSQIKQAGITILCNPKVQVGHEVMKTIFGNEAEE